MIIEQGLIESLGMGKADGLGSFGTYVIGDSEVGNQFSTSPAQSQLFNLL
jgi:hypothetical protein